jgi:hypothetical protein
VLEPATGEDLLLHSGAEDLNHEIQFSKFVMSGLELKRDSRV